MRLRLLLGRARTGKTRRCLEEVSECQRQVPLGPPLLLLVPDQATFTMEQELAARGGGMRAQVFSFRRLAYRVLRELGAAGLIPVSELGRRMLLKKILMRCRGELPLFSTMQNRPGFLHSLAELIGEFKACRVGPEELSSLVGEEGTDGLLSQKLKETSAVYRYLEEEMAGRLTDPEGWINLLAHRLHQASFLKDCQVWVDGFTSFTPQEYAVIGALGRWAREITVTLCLDPQQAEEQITEFSPFYQSWCTFRRLKQLAREKAFEWEVLELKREDPEYPTGVQELIHLERYYFQYPTKDFPGPVERVHIAAAVNPRSEAEGIARAIRRLLRAGVRPRQIMVAVRNLDLYFPLLRRVLADYEIPFFLDHQLPVFHHPLIELLRAVLEIERSQWAYEPVFRAFKTGFWPVPQAEIDLLENYVLAAGIRGNRWLKDDPWTWQPGRTWREEEQDKSEGWFDLSQINDIRYRASAPLIWLQRQLAAAAVDPRPRRLRGRDWARLLVEFCLQLKVPARLDAWSQAALAAGNPERAREHRQVWRGVVGVLDELAAVLGEELLAEDELAAILDAAWEALRLSLIPPRLDAVTVGTLERSHPPSQLAVLFVAGLNDGVLPSGVRTYSVLTDTEREQLAQLLASKNKELSPGTEDRWQREQYLIYSTLTRAAEQLWLTYPLGDSEGKALLPSPVVKRVQEVLPGVKVYYWPSEPPGGSGDLEWLEHPSGLLPHLVGRWRQALAGRTVHPAWWRLYNLLREVPAWRERMSMARDGLWFCNEEPPLGEELALKMWTRYVSGRRVVNLSVSGLETFARCPFAFFLTAGLKLRERREFGLAPPLTGQFYHEAMRRLVEEAAAIDVSWKKLDDQQVNQLSLKIVDELAENLQNSILLSSARLKRQKEHLWERVYHSARALVRQYRQSCFRPMAVEVAVTAGAAAGTGCSLVKPGSLQTGLELPAWQVILPAPGGEQVVMTISGRIDRLDVAEDKGEWFVRVVDYKTTPQDLELAEVLAGQQLQLLLYLLIAQSGLGARPGGAFYFPVIRPLLNERIAEQTVLEQKWLKEYRLKGWVLGYGEPFYRLMDAGLTRGTGSLLVPLYLKKDGSLHAGYVKWVYTPKEWKVLEEEIKVLLRAMGHDLLSGRVDIAPVQTGKRSACDNCGYHQVCGFDLLHPENRPRLLFSSSQELRQKLQEKVGGREDVSLVLYYLDRQSAKGYNRPRG